MIPSPAASVASRIFTSGSCRKAWLFDFKYDGFRALCYIEQGRCRVISRNGNVLSRFDTLGNQVAAVLDADDAGVAFRWKDYRIDGPGRWKTMRLHPHEFIRRFLLHVLPKRFHRIRHYGLFANANRAETIAKARAFHLANPIDFAPDRAPDRDSADLTASDNSL